MKRRALVAAVLLSLVLTSPASAYSRGGGKSDRAPGQERSTENCDSHVLDQKQRGVNARGGPKRPSEETNEAPTNCDHFWQNDGHIGKS